MDNPNVFGKWLSMQIRRRDMSQIALATKAGLSKSSISAYVNGERVPDPASCDRIADALGINLDVVLSQAGHRPQVERVPASDQKLAILGMVDRIDWTDDANYLIAMGVLRPLMEKGRRKQ